MPNPPRRARFQIHLSTAIVLMFAAEACIGLWISQRKILRLENDLSQRDERIDELKNELELLQHEGYGFAVDAITITPVRVDAEREWAWTVYMAKDRRIDIGVELKNIGGVSGTATTSLPLELKKGLYRIQVEIQRRQDGAAVLQLTLPSHAKTAPTRDVVIAAKPGDSDWIFYRPTQSNTAVGKRVSSQPPMRLLDFNGTNPSGGAKPGIMIELR